MKINGWHRLWIVGAFVWALVIAGVTFPMLVTANGTTDWDLIRSAALVWIGSSVAVLLVGHGLAWAGRGFRGGQR